MYKIIIPATSANLGPGFDCMGLALNMYNVIEVEEIEDGLRIEINGPKDRIPTNEDNLIYKAMKALFDKVGYKPKGLRIIQTNGIPITRGLGSSAACIVGGIFAANCLAGKKMSRDELAVFAASMDGHPDNTTPAIMGGLVAAVLEKQKLYHVKIEIPDSLKFAAFIPKFTLSTKKARMILPERISHKDAVFNESRAALLTASLALGKLENLVCAFDDKLHQPYRKQFIPDMDKIFDRSMKCGARGCYLSGAGPILIAVIDSNYEKFYQEMNLHLKKTNENWGIKLLDIDKKGVEVFVNENQLAT